MLGLALCVKSADSFTSTPAAPSPTLHPKNLPLSLPTSLSAPRRTGDRLHVAAAAGLLLLRLDVVVYLELGFVGLLRRSVLQLPDS